jgi:hypothetical protein
MKNPVPVGKFGVMKKAPIPLGKQSLKAAPKLSLLPPPEPILEEEKPQKEKKSKKKESEEPVDQSWGEYLGGFGW